MNAAAINLSMTLKKSKQTTLQLLGKYSVSSIKVLFNAWKKQTDRSKSVKEHMKVLSFVYFILILECIDSC